MAPMRTIERIRVIMDVIPLFKIEVSSHPLRRITRLSFPNAVTLLESDAFSHALESFSNFNPTPSLSRSHQYHRPRSNSYP